MHRGLLVLLSVEEIKDFLCFNLLGCALLCRWRGGSLLRGLREMLLQLVDLILELSLRGRHRLDRLKTGLYGLGKLMDLGQIVAMLGLRVPKLIVELVVDNVGHVLKGGSYDRTNASSDRLLEANGDLL